MEKLILQNCEYRGALYCNWPTIFQVLFLKIGTGDCFWEIVALVSARVDKGFHFG